MSTGYLPAAVSESTAAERKRIEGLTISFTANDTLAAGDIVKLPNGSGIIRAVTLDLNTQVQGVVLYTAASGQRTTIIKGEVQATWDGAGTLNPGTLIGVSATRSGWFEPSAGTSGDQVIGVYQGLSAAAAGNSGTLMPVRIP